MKNIPSSLNEKIKSHVHNELHPKLSYLIAKVFAIHVGTAVLTLSLCPQFGFKFFNLPFNLMNSFMIFGMPFCNFLCGLFFTSTSMMMVSFLLKRDELRALKFQKSLTTGFLILSSLGFFSIMNPTLFLEFSFLWLFGAILGVIITLETSSRLLARA